MKKWIITTAFLLLSQLLPAQTRKFSVGADLPLFYSLSYEEQLPLNFSINGKAGVLTHPFDKAIINILENFDVNKVLLNTIGESFTIGYNFQPTLKWNYKNAFIGVSYSYLILHANDCPVAAIELYYYYTFISFNPVKLDLQSDLHNVGLCMGYRFPIKSSPFSIQTEISLLKTVASNNYVETNLTVTSEVLTRLIDDELNDFFVQKAYLPSINIMLSYSF